MYEIYRILLRLIYSTFYMSLYIIKTRETMDRTKVLPSPMAMQMPIGILTSGHGCKGTLLPVFPSIVIQRHAIFLCPKHLVENQQPQNLFCLLKAGSAISLFLSQQINLRQPGQGLCRKQSSMSFLIYGEVSTGHIIIMQVGSH